MSFPRYPEYKASGVEWLGDVPGHWGVKKFRWLFTILKDIAGTVGFDVFSVTQKGIRIKDIESNNGQLSMDYSKYQLVHPGDFVMNHMDLLTGGADIAVSLGVTSPDYRVFRNTNRSVLNQRFGLYLFQKCYQNKIFYSFGQGSSQLGRWRLPTDQFQEFLFPIPPLDEQEFIADFLDRETAKIDGLIEEQRRLVELLKEKRQAVISHAVTKGLNPNAPMKPSGIEWLGDIPEHWEVKRMGNLSNVVRGASPRPAGDPRYFSGDFMPWVTVGEITKDNAIYLKETEFYLTEEGAGHSRMFEPETLIYSNSGATLGVPKILSIQACANDGIIGFLNLVENANSTFLHFYLGSITEFIREKIKQGSGQPNLNTDIVKSLAMPLPPLNEQNRIVDFIKKHQEAFDNLISEAEKSITLLQERRTALISAAVTGKIDVRGLIQVESKS